MFRFERQRLDGHAESHGRARHGGAIADPSPFPDDSEVVEILVGPSVFASFQGGDERTVSVGDIIVIPAGVLHGWSDIPDHVTYLSVRPDPDRVLPAGYVNPALTQ